MERLLRPTLDRWMFLGLLALSLAGNLLRWPMGGAAVFVLNVLFGVASGFALYGLVLLVVVVADRARTRLGTRS